MRTDIGIHPIGKAIVDIAGIRLKKGERLDRPSMTLQRTGIGIDPPLTLDKRHAPSGCMHPLNDVGPMVLQLDPRERKGSRP